MDIDRIAEINMLPEALAKPIPSHFRVGLIAAGRIVQSEIMSAYRAAGIMPVAAADPDPAARDSLRAQWGVERVFADYREMLDTVAIDVVDINLRWDVGLSPTRVDAVAMATSRGIHVIIAKPMAENWEQCQAMVAHARRGGVILAVDQNSRFGPAFYGCWALIRAGALGELISASINYHSALGRQHTNAFHAVHDVCVHGVDILLSWFDEEPHEVYAHWSRRVDGIGSVLAATFSFANGANATLLYDFATRHRRQFEFSAVGETASVDGLQDQELPAASRVLRSTLRYGPHHIRGLALEIPLAHTMSPGSYLATRADLLQSIEEGRHPWASGENVLRTMNTLFALLRSIEKGQPIRPAELFVTTGSPSGEDAT